jgi:hypothetical protein
MQAFYLDTEGHSLTPRDHFSVGGDTFMLSQRFLRVESIASTSPQWTVTSTCAGEPRSISTLMREENGCESKDWFSEPRGCREKIRFRSSVGPAVPALCPQTAGDTMTYILPPEFPPAFPGLQRVRGKKLGSGVEGSSGGGGSTRAGISTSGMANMAAWKSTTPAASISENSIRSRES